MCFIPCFMSHLVGARDVQLRVLSHCRRRIGLSYAFADVGVIIWKMCQELRLCSPWRRLLASTSRSQARESGANSQNSEPLRSASLCRRARGRAPGRGRSSLGGQGQRARPPPPVPRLEANRDYCAHFVAGQSRWGGGDFLSAGYTNCCGQRCQGRSAPREEKVRPRKQVLLSKPKSCCFKVRRSRRKRMLPWRPGRSLVSGQG